MKKLATITMGCEVVHVELEIEDSSVTEGLIKADALIAIYKQGFITIEIDAMLGNVIDLPTRIQ